MPVLLENELESEAIDTEWVVATAERLLAILGQEDKELSILLVNDERMTELNGQYRQKFKPTNVLSFPMQEEPDPFSQNLLGDIVISVETAAREAREEDITLKQRLTFLLVHGLLHLLGDDHERSEVEAERMGKREQELIRDLQSQGG